MQSSHRMRVEEKRLVRKLVITVTLFLAAIVFAVYVGLPLFARIILTFSSLKKDPTVNAQVTPSPLFPPTLNPMAESTNSAAIAVSGFTEKDTKVKIMVNSVLKTTVDPDDNGAFTAAHIPLEEGDNIISAIEIKDKQESSPSSLTVTYKKKAPKLDINSPKDGEKIITDSRDITVTGNTDTGNRVTVNDRFAIVDNIGKFSYTVTLSDGENKIKVIVTDDAGNTSEKEIKVTYSP